MGESRPRSPVQTEYSEVCTSDQGQDSVIQTDLARLIRCLLHGCVLYAIFLYTFYLFFLDWSRCWSR